MIKAKKKKEISTDEIMEIINSIFEEGGQNSEMIAETMEENGYEYSEDVANKILNILRVSVISNLKITVSNIKQIKL